MFYEYFLIGSLRYILVNYYTRSMNKMEWLLHKKSYILVPISGMVFFALLSFVHDGFQTDRSLQSYYIPLIIGFTVGLIIRLYQHTIETNTRSFERQLSKEREAAALGRAAATIAHEVRNPLNALSIGLQRLQIEVNEFRPEHQHLVDLMLDAVRRANSIVSGLLSYTRPQTPKPKSMRIDRLLENTMNLYLFRCTELGIKVIQRIEFRDSFFGDPDLLSQVVENLIRNAIEAQPQGGHLYLEAERKNQEIVLKFRNGGFFLHPNEAEQIMEPYFTTKMNGSCLGLPIARSIIEAHGGHLEFEVKEENTIEFAAYLPLDHDFDEISSKTKGRNSA